jgi:diguanylate cyclase (GGDEF)-like protein
MVSRRTLTSLLVGASAAMIALSSLATIFLMDARLVSAWLHIPLPWLHVLASSTAILLIMSLLHGDLHHLYRKLADAEVQARQDARRDALTGLGNRTLLYEALDQCAEPGQDHKFSALLLIDLDNFKRVNDSLGHRAGDQLIVIAAQRICQAFPDAVIARLGGDEFALIVDLDSPAQLTEVCARLIGNLNGVARLADSECHIAGSLGATVLEPGMTVSDSMRQADLAMYRAKGDASGFKIFDSAMSAEADRRARLSRDLPSALEQGELTARFQTIMTPAGELWALEALLRWHHAELGQIPPPEIVEIAEEMHLVNEVALVIAREACAAARAFPDLLVALNISAIQLLDEVFTAALRGVLADEEIDPRQILLEVNEADVVERSRAIADTLTHLNEAGFNLAVDDYGSSTCSLSELRRLGVSILKLDPNVLKNAVDAGSIAVMRANVALAKSLGMVVVSEGISSKADEDAAKQAGCDYLQGFRYCRPVELGSLVAAHRHQAHRIAS